MKEELWGRENYWLDKDEFFRPPAATCAWLASSAPSAEYKTVSRQTGLSPAERESLVIQFILFWAAHPREYISSGQGKRSHVPPPMPEFPAWMLFKYQMKMLIFCLSPRHTQPASLKASFLMALGARRLQVSCNFHFPSSCSLQGKHSVDNMVGSKKSKAFLIPNCFVCHCNWAVSFPRAASQTAGEGLFLNECVLQEMLCA